MNTNAYSQNQYRIGLTTRTNHIGGGHSHPEDTYPMFSFADLKLLGIMYDNATPNRQAEVFYNLVAKNPNGSGVLTYVMKVDNYSSLIDRINLTL
ncbi:MAG: hypothetical protein H7174_13335 [Flavobacterium sp.]|nr:hypothetical protein [Flavobacterium sp.]